MKTLDQRRERIVRELGILIVVSTLLSSSVWAFSGTCGLMADFGLNPQMASILELTEEQKALIWEKHEAFIEGINPLRNRLFSRKMELRELWKQGNPDQGKISAMQREIQAAQNQLQEKIIQYQMECRELLSPEQQEKLGTAMAHHGSRRPSARFMNGW